MKILHLCKKYPDAMGGDAVVVANLQKQQETAGHEVVIVTSNCPQIKSGDKIYKIGLADSPAGLDEITPKRIISLLILFFKMFAVLRAEQPDVIHTHSVDMAFFASFAARFYKIPIVHTFHIVTFYDAQQSFIRRKTETWLAKNTNPHATTAPNMFDVKQLKAAGLAQTVLLPNGIDTDFWQLPKRTQQNSKFEFVAIGRLERQKGYDYLIKAAYQLIITGHDNFRVTIVGEGSQRDVLQKQLQNAGLQANVSLIGSRDPAQIKKILASTDAVVLPSLYETTPLTLLEAWAAKLPVIATRVGILRGVATDAALVVPPKDEHALAQAMKQCMTQQKHMQAIAKKGQAESQKYAWPIIGSQAEAIYRSVA